MRPEVFPYLLLTLAVIAASWLVGVVLVRRSKDRRRAAAVLAGGLLGAFYVTAVVALTVGTA